MQYSQIICFALSRDSHTKNMAVSFQKIVSEALQGNVEGIKKPPFLWRRSSFIIYLTSNVVFVNNIIMIFFNINLTNTLYRQNANCNLVKRFYVLENLTLGFEFTEE